MPNARTRRQLRRVGACLVVGALLVACGDDDDDAASVTSGAAIAVATTASGAETTEAAVETTEAAAETTEAAAETTEAAADTTAGAAESTSPDDVVATTAAASIAATSEPTASLEPTASSERSASSAPGSSAPASEICAARDELAESVNALGDISISNITSGGLSALGDAIGEVKTDLAALGSAAGSSLRSQVQDVQDYIGELESAVQALGDDGITVSGVRTAAGALGDVVTSAGSLLQSLNARCPTSTVVIESIPTSSLEAVTATTG